MKKYVLLALLIAIGGVLSFAAFLSLLKICESWKVFFQIVSSLGNGIFASAIITLLIEKGNDKRLKSKISEQKEYLLSDIRFMMPTILRNEIRTMSEYIAISKNNKSKMKTSNENFSSMLYSAQKLLETINDYHLNELMTYSNGVFSVEDIKHLQKKDKVLFEEMCPYYERLKKYVMIIIEKKEIYLMNDLLTQSDFDNLQGFVYLIDDMITYCVNKNIELLIDYKNMFFKEIIKLGDIVLGDTNHTFMISQFETDDQDD